MALTPEQFSAAKSGAARKAAATKVAGREIKKCIEQVCAVAKARLGLWKTYAILVQDGEEDRLEARHGMPAFWPNVEAYRAAFAWVNANQWATGSVGPIEDFDVESSVALAKRRLIQAAQAHSPDVQIRRRNGGLVFEAKVTLEGIQSAAQQVLGEGWQSELPVPRLRRRRSN